jgi:phosphatidylglycerol---prolipoprotein diacylglyceryl transferase
MLAGYVIWNVNPEIFRIGPFSLRWYGLLFAAGFFFGYLMFQGFFKKKNLSIELLDKLTIYMVIATVIGARLGHCFFYDASYYLANPLKILKIWEGGLASHGAAIGILLAMYFFVKKFKVVTYLWLLDRIVITVALAGCLIRLGNLMNSEIYGVETKANYGVVFTRPLADAIEEQANESYGKKLLESVTFAKDLSQTGEAKGSAPMKVILNFKSSVPATDIGPLANSILQPFVRRIDRSNDYNAILAPQGNDSLTVNKHQASLGMKGIPKHPTQVYEALSYFLIFLLLMGIYRRKGETLNDGLIFGLFLLLVFGSRFFIEFIKEDQSVFESGMPLNMGQLLSIPFVITGIWLIWNAQRKAVAR